MSFKRRISTRKRVGRALSRAHRRIEKLNLELQKMTIQKKPINKRYERALKKVNKNCIPSTSHDSSMSSTDSPRSKANQDLRNAGMSPRSVPKGLKKQLLLSHALLDEIRESTEINQGQKARRMISNVLSGKIIKKYRLIARVSRESGLGQRNLSKTKKQGITAAKYVKKAWGVLHNEVLGFMERDDNSRMMPGKREACKTSSTKEKRQIRYLNDYMMNLPSTKVKIPSNGRFLFPRLRKSDKEMLILNLSNSQQETQVFAKNIRTLPLKVKRIKISRCDHNHKPR
ncbi:uncharacterized protein [Antedon mediterranea]|uniref:uncharacterized protein n=1 Tax=Antedon mediterranea TaxID=105859 RepID=UPI003AF9CD3E